MSRHIPKPTRFVQAGYKPVEGGFDKKEEENQETSRERTARHRQERREELRYTASDEQRWARNRERVITERVAKVLDTRAAIMNELLTDNDIIRRKDWHAKPSKNNLDYDWDYDSIVLHHAGNSYQCSNHVADIQIEHLKKFDDIGYHYAINCNGVIFEGRPLIFKGSHVDDGNTKKIGIVMIGDFSIRGEADFKLNDTSTWGDQVDFDEVGEVPSSMHNALISLINSILKYFPTINSLGGHREYAQILGDDRSCPGQYGIDEVNKLRSKFSLSTPL
ncbi:peptidoglycan recognition protein family protein [Aliivibrio sifiae]